jgi:hypothetical protein
MHQAQPLVEMGSGELFAPAGLESQSSHSPPPDRITGLSHCFWPQNGFENSLMTLENVHNVIQKQKCTA